MRAMVDYRRLEEKFRHVLPKLRPISIRAKDQASVMSLTSQLTHLSDVQLKSLCDTMLNAAIAHENGGNAREIFRRAKHRHIGLMHRIYAMLASANQDEINRLSASMAEIESERKPG